MTGQRNIPSSKKMNNEAWLVVGVLIGSICHTPTTLTLIGGWMFLRNPVLPTVLGGKKPQELLVDLFKMIYMFVQQWLFRRSVQGASASKMAAVVQSTVSSQSSDKSTSTPTSPMVFTDSAHTIVAPTSSTVPPVAPMTTTTLAARTTTTGHQLHFSLPN